MKRRLRHSSNFRFSETAFKIHPLVSLFFRQVFSTAAVRPDQELRPCAIVSRATSLAGSSVSARTSQWRSRIGFATTKLFQI